MLENATNLTNTTIVGILPTIKTVLTFVYGVLLGSGVIAVVLSFFFWKTLQKNQHEHEQMMEHSQRKHEKEMEKARREYDEKVQRQDKEYDALEKIRDGFFSEEMRDGMTRLGKLKILWGNDFATIFSKRSKNNDPDAIQLNKYRWLYSHHFHDNIFDPSCEVSDEFIRRAVRVDQVELLLEFVEPLEEAKNPRYDKHIFDACRRIFRDDLKEELKER